MLVNSMFLTMEFFVNTSFCFKDCSIWFAVVVCCAFRDNAINKTTKVDEKQIPININKMKNKATTDVQGWNNNILKKIFFKLKEENYKLAILSIG